MSSSAVPVVATIVAAFLLFIVVVGGVSIWTSLPSHKDGQSDPGD
jgi:hypothetical protein